MIPKLVAIFFVPALSICQALCDSRHSSLNDSVSHPYTDHRNGDTARTKEFDGHEAFMNNPLNAEGRSCNGDNAVLGYSVDLLKDGYLQFNGKPGLGITLDEKLAKEKYMVAGETWWD